MTVKRALESEGFSWLNNPLPNIEPYSIYKENSSIANKYSFGLFGQRYLENYRAHLKSLLKIHGAATLPEIETLKTWKDDKQTYKSSIFANIKGSAFPFFDWVSKANASIESNKDVEWTLILEGVRQSRLVDSFKLNNALKGAKLQVSKIDEQWFMEGNFFMVTESFSAEKVLIFASDSSKQELKAKVNSVEQFNAESSAMKQETLGEVKLYNDPKLPLTIGAKVSRIRFDPDIDSFYLDDPQFEPIRGNSSGISSTQSHAEIFIL